MDTDVVLSSGAGILGGESTSGTLADVETPESTIDEVDHILDEVEAALTRLDEGTYGACAGCGSTIDDARLSGDPTVRTCAGCDAGASGAGTTEAVDDTMDATQAASAPAPVDYGISSEEELAEGEATDGPVALVADVAADAEPAATADPGYAPWADRETPGD